MGKILDFEKQILLLRKDKFYTWDPKLPRLVSPFHNQYVLIAQSKKGSRVSLPNFF